MSSRRSEQRVFGSCFEGVHEFGLKVSGCVALLGDDQRTESPQKTPINSMTPGGLAPPPCNRVNQEP